MRQIAFLDPIDNVPVIDGNQTRIGRLLLALTDTPPSVPIPCWVDCKDSSTKITEENKESIVLGLMLAIEMQDALDNNEENN